MKHRFSFNRLSRRFVNLAVVLIATVVLVTVGFSTIKHQGKFTAEEELRFDDVPAAPLYAAACGPASQFKCELQRVTDDIRRYNIGQSVVQQIKVLFENANSFCHSTLDQDLMKADSVLPPTHLTISGPLTQCTFNGESRKDGQIWFDGTIAVDIPGADFVTKYKTLSEANNGDENYGISGKANASYNNISYVRTEDTDQNGVTHYKWEKAVPGEDEGYTNFHGSFNGPAALTLDGKDDLGNYLKDFGDIIIDRESSYWKLSTEGQANADLALTWSPTAGENEYNVILTKFDFCRETCTMTTAEEQKIVARKLGTTDGVSGNLESYLKYTDTYHGTGQGDPSTQTAHWNSDLELTKERNKTWRQDLKMVDERAEHWVYTGDITSSADIYPFQDQHAVVQDKVKKDLTWGLNTNCRRRGCDGTQTGHALTDKKETNDSKVVNGQTINNITREGPGNIQITSTASGSNISFSGVFDNNSPTMLVTAASWGPWIGQRKDPFENTPTEMSAQYLSGRFPVNGLFTVSLGNPRESVIDTLPAKELLKKILITNAFDAEDSKRFDVAGTVQKVQVAARKVGITVQYIEAPSFDKLLLAIHSGGGPGVLLLHLGHGAPTGLKFPEDDNEEVPLYSKLSLLLDAKGMWGQMMADSCYFGHSPFASLYGGSLGVGIRDVSGGAFGNTFGIGKNSFQETGSFVISKVCALIKR